MYFPTFYSVVAFNPSAVSSCFCWSLLDLTLSRGAHLHKRCTHTAQHTHARTHADDEFRRRKKNLQHTPWPCVCVCKAIAPVSDGLCAPSMVVDFQHKFRCFSAGNFGDARRQFQFQSISHSLLTLAGWLASVENLQAPSRCTSRTDVLLLYTPESVPTLE